LGEKAERAVVGSHREKENGGIKVSCQQKNKNRATHYKMMRNPAGTKKNGGCLHSSEGKLILRPRSRGTVCLPEKQKVENPVTEGRRRTRGQISPARRWKRTSSIYTGPKYSSTKTFQRSRKRFFPAGHRKRFTVPAGEKDAVERGTNTQTVGSLSSHKKTGTSALAKKKKSLEGGQLPNKGKVLRKTEHEF